MKKGSNIYIVGTIQEEATLNICEEIKLSWVDGQVGACPVFTNKKKAEKYTRSFPKNNRPIIIERSIK